MTNEEAISHIRDILAENNSIKPSMVVFESEKEALRVAIEALEQQPKTGHWINIQFFKADITYYRPKCPFCSIEPEFYSNFCPNCGARMVESEE